MKPMQIVVMYQLRCYNTSCCFTIAPSNSTSVSTVTPPSTKVTPTTVTISDTTSTMGKYHKYKQTPPCRVIIIYAYICGIFQMEHQALVLWPPCLCTDIIKNINSILAYVT